jgi:hypothetical protein
VSTDVDAPADVPPASARGSRRYLWLAAAVVVLLGAALTLYRAGVFGGSDDGTGGDYREQLSATVVNVLEQMPAEGHGHHGDLAQEPGQVELVCGVNVYGTNPADADTVDEVAQVYGYHMCALPQKGLQWIMSPKLTGPLVVTLAADPPTVTVVEGGADFPDRVRATIPEPYQEQALKGSLTAEGMRELIRRYDEAAGKVSG